MPPIILLREQLEEERNKKAQEKEEKEEARLQELERIVQSLNDDVSELTDRKSVV